MHLRNWWDNVVTIGPLLGHHPNASKSWLVLKPIEEEKARHVFENTNIKATIEEKVTLVATSEVKVVRLIMLKN